MKKWVKVLSMLIVAVLMLTACSGGGNGKDTTPVKESEIEKTDSDVKNKDITVVLMAKNSDYWNMVEAGAILAAKEKGYNVSVIGPNSEEDAVGQSNMVQDAANNKVAAIVLAPTEPKVLVKAAEYVKSVGIPLVIVDAALATDDETLFDSFLGTDNREAGKAAGEYLSAKLEKGDKVAIIRGLVGQPSHDYRSDGAVEAFEAAGMEVVSIQPADSDRGKAVNVMQNILQNYPDLKAVYCTNDEMALGAYQALKGMQLQDDVLTMGFDGSFGALDSIKAGELTASLAQKPIDEGYFGVMLAIDIIEGREVEKYIQNGFVIVDKDNVEEFSADIDQKMTGAGLK